MVAMFTLSAASVLNGGRPDTTHFRVVFDVTKRGLDSLPYMAALAGAFVLLFLVGWRKPEFVIAARRLLGSQGLETPTAMRSVAMALGVAGLLVSVLVVGGEYVARQELRSALSGNRYTLVEGPVSQFVVADSVRHTPESFVVAGHRYVFHEWRGTLGFDGRFASPDALKNGTLVRISDVSGVIARLEVANGPHSQN